MNQTTDVHSLFRNMQGNPDSTIREIFAFGIGNTGHFCSWDPEYGKFLFVGSQAAQGHYVWVRASEVIWSEYTRIISVLSDAK